MKLHDGAIGTIVACFGAFVAAHARTLNPPRHLDYGPGFFPLLIGIGLMGVGGLIVLNGVRGGRGQPLFVAPVWVRSGTMALRFWILPAAIGFYLLAVEWLGFLMTSITILASIMAVNGVSLRRSVGLAVALSVLVNVIFASILHVPLPWGFLTPVSGWLIW